MEVKKEKKHGPKLSLEQRSLTCLLTALQGTISRLSITLNKII